MAEFGEKKSAVGPPVAGWKAASGGAGASLETHRGEPVSNGNCSVSDVSKRVQSESSCESPTWESTGSDSASKPIPRRSSLIKDGPCWAGEEDTVSQSAVCQEKKISSAAETASTHGGQPVSYTKYVYIPNMNI
ncbi:inactive phospholipase C-like protein 2 [Lates japonicus]|uniref:Inactive phospholipase C-like protein 2 n=1 Tax=Lates japonicus TaxID=270547 RepID=A0AAD3MQ38_LATJO|nr:inactive phospholipase C-like protein 2 [Lates japonicus]